jgi:hypothetical protein
MKRIFDKIVGWLNKIGADKYKHFAVGTAVAAIVLLAVALFVPQWLALTASVVAVIAAAVGKEKVDAKADLRDIVATLCGGAVVWITYLIG